MPFTPSDPKKHETGTAPIPASVHLPSKIFLLCTPVSSVYTEYINMNGIFLISQSDKRPMYIQIMEQIKQKIALGDWTPVARQSPPSANLP